MTSSLNTCQVLEHLFGVRLTFVFTILIATFGLSYSTEFQNRTLTLSFMASIGYEDFKDIDTAFEGKLIAGAFFIALEDVNNNNTLLKDHKLEYLFNDTKMNPLNAINAMTHHYDNGRGIIGFIGPDVSCMCESTVAAAWNLPMIGYRCHDSKFGKSESVIRRTFARTQPSTSKVSKSIVSILQYYQWKRYTLIVEASAKWNETADSLIHLSKLNNLHINRTVYFISPYNSHSSMYDVVFSTHKTSRIYVFLGDVHALVDFARLLKRLVKSDMSDYVTIAPDERMYSTDPREYLIKRDSPKDECNAVNKTGGSLIQEVESNAESSVPFEEEAPLTPEYIEPFETVLQLVPGPPVNPEWETFLDKVREKNEEPPINGVPRQHAGDKIRVPITAAYLYDAVYTYALALDAVIKTGGNVTDGLAIIAQIRNKTIKSILGYDVHIDKDGDAEGNYTILTFHSPDEGESVELVTAGNFRMSHGDLGIPDFNLFKEIKWRRGSPPPDEPKCGFDGERCIQEFDWRLVTVCIVVVTITLIAGGFFLRHYLYEQKLDRLLWKVDFKEVDLSVSEDYTVPLKQKKRKNGTKSHPFKKFLSYDDESESKATLLGDSKREHSVSSEMGRRNLIGCYKGTNVSIKRIVKKSVEIDRELKKQLQLRKELNHDNVARFIGACVETPYVYILTQNCSRGSLQDILNDEDITLDDMFITSLISDLIKAMTFIHESDIGSHGNLKTSNCLVDSRWVLLVTDFGLHKLVNERSGSVTDMKKHYDSLLWKAPELLRNSNRDPAGSQKGDVYAFAFILYEMFGRKGPWGETLYTSQVIVDNVKCGDTTGKPFRPDVSSLSCESFIIECIQECWQEDPDLRPDFKRTKDKLNVMLTEINSNIFDNLLSRMEKYANNLEGLVAERTEALSEEKKMTENLLLRMLPRFVADRLKRGEPVIPEQYDCVSIYFSDIVGFTSLSAESTPMEVVCMLNDLYTCFDAIIENYDVYKIETIGDAYFVVSGLPVRNEDLHAGEIASMSLHMLRALSTFRVKHKPDHSLKLRIGLHSGPCVAGVVGLKMPRYTLFGDTVNTASRMETTGVPLKIHCSEDVTKLLRNLGGYTLTQRGYVNAKGKGQMLTYFLEDEDETQRQRRISSTKMFSRTNSPCTPEEDFLVPHFGKSPIHPKYWPNGAMALWTEVETSHPCDKENNSPKKPVCDISSDSSASVAYDRLSEPNSPISEIPPCTNNTYPVQSNDSTTTSSNNHINRAFSPITTHAQISTPEEQTVGHSQSPELVSRLLLDRAVSLDDSMRKTDNFDFNKANRIHLSSDAMPRENNFENIPLIKYTEINRKRSIPRDLREDKI